MSYVIDHAINIPASTQRVWAIISDISKNPIWQADCESVAFLTSKHSGVATRWRYGDASGHETVCEISAWYEGLGYEYQIIDGTPYQGKNRGRIRLQEIAEGTVVQWTFNYELGGPLATVRNIGIKRGLEQNITDSLRNLYSYIKTTQQEFEAAEIKSLMRDAPSVEERSQYKPRHPSALEQKAASGIPYVDSQNESIPQKAQEIPEVTEDPLLAFRRPGSRPEPKPEEALFAKPAIEEPPIADDDTRPNPTIITTPEEAALPAASMEEPSFLSDLPEWARTSAQIRDGEPFKPPASELAQEISFKDETLIKDENKPLTPTPEAEMPEAPTSAADSWLPPAPVINEDLTQNSEASPTEQQADLIQASTKPESVSARLLPEIPELDPMDTARMSVFELFGLQKPSETQEMRALTNQDLRASQELRRLKTAESKVVGRVGLRTVMRLRSIRVRRPRI